MPSKDKDLEPVTDLKTVQRYLKYGVEFHETVSCFIEDANLRFDAHLKSVDATKLTLEMDILEDAFAKFTADHLAAIDRPQGLIRLSFSVNEATFFLHSKVQGRTSRQLVAKAEMPMFKLQRREALRIKVLESHKASIKLGSVVLPLFDISAGGLSVIVALVEEKNYKNGQAFPGSILSFLGKDMKVDLEVQNVLSHGKDGLKAKIGFHFKALPASIEQMIAREAYLHTHKIWSRWL